MTCLMKTDLISDIDAFLAETRMGEYRFGLLAANNGRLLDRLRQSQTPKRGRPVRIWPETEVRIRTFMAVERAKRAEKVGAA